MENKTLYQDSGIRYYPVYREWLKGKIIDYGCRVGELVRFIRSFGMNAEGVGELNAGTGMWVGDITKPFTDADSFQTALCINHLQNYSDEQHLAIFSNMMKSERQVISVFWEPSPSEKNEVNNKPLQEWKVYLSLHFNIHQSRLFSNREAIFLSTSKDFYNAEH